MPVINRIADMHSNMTEWRRHLHSIPEPGFDLLKTSSFVESKLHEFGVDEVHTGKAPLAAEVAKSVVCESHVNTDTNPIFPAEDFAYMLKERPGAYSFIGQGHSAPVHHPK